MTTYKDSISREEDIKNKVNSLLWYLYVFTKHFTYLQVHWVRVPDELPEVIIEAREWIENFSLQDQVVELIEKKIKHNQDLLKYKDEVWVQANIRLMALKELLYEIKLLNN